VAPSSTGGGEGERGVAPLAPYLLRANPSRSEMSRGRVLAAKIPRRGRRLSQAPHHLNLRLGAFAGMLKVT
jgi:hypothetical protein